MTWHERYAEAGARLKALRTQQDLSIYKLESVSHVKYDMLLKMENGTRGMTVRNAIKLAPVLDTTPTFLLFGP